MSVTHIVTIRPEAGIDFVEADLCPRMPTRIAGNYYTHKIKTWGGNHIVHGSMRNRKIIGYADLVFDIGDVRIGKEKVGLNFSNRLWQ